MPSALFCLSSSAIASLPSLIRKPVSYTGMAKDSNLPQSEEGMGGALSLHIFLLDQRNNMLSLDKAQEEYLFSRTTELHDRETLLKNPRNNQFFSPQTNEPSAIPKWLKAIA